ASDPASQGGQGHHREHNRPAHSHTETRRGGEGGARCTARSYPFLQFSGTLSVASISSPTFMFWIISFEAWNSWVIPSVPLTASSRAQPTRRLHDFTRTRLRFTR